MVRKSDSCRCCAKDILLENPCLAGHIKPFAPPTPIDSTAMHLHSDRRSTFCTFLNLTVNNDDVIAPGNTSLCFSVLEVAAAEALAGHLMHMRVWKQEWKRILPQHGLFLEYLLRPGQ